MASNRKGLVLGLNCTSDFSITDEQGKVYSIEEAKRLYEAGKLADYNLALKRLAQCGWDLDAVKRYFGKAANSGQSL